ncbi:hypothetical protein [Wolbachia endosymbiont (group A) of Bombylius major]|uniref:hypothetical protein n=1 Tax=Wolbachia endosymbiont (group A) of Bombylius major TaxID=2953988 RepID=UPI00222E63C5|nr:hypothetical protein [Wolbachia endosymbiont (group A) of Bombylius major]
MTGEKGVTERKLFNFDNQGQLALNGNTMLYSQVSRKIIGDQEVRKTHIFKFDMAKVVEDLKSGKKDECLLGKKNCQINKVPSFSSEYEISFLQYVKRIKGDDLVAFLAGGRLPNKQMLHLTSLVKNGSKSNFTVCEFADSIEQLYVKDSGQDSFIVTAVSEENIAIFNHQRFEKPSKVTIIPASSIKTLSDFVDIINGRLIPGIISSTIAPVTITETVVTSKKTPTAAITSTAETDAVKTTKLTTEAVAPTSTISKPSTESTTVAKTTTTSQATTVATTSTSVPIVTSGTETSTVKPTSATVASTSTMNKPSTESTIQTSTVTVKPTTIAKTTTTSQATTVATTSTSAPIVTSETETSTVKPTTAAKATVTLRATTATERVTMSTNGQTTLGQTVFTIPSAETKESTTPIFTTTLLPQTTSSPQPTQLAIGSNRAGMIGGSLVGAIGIVGIIGFIAYRYVKGRNAAPVLELTDLGYRRRSSSSSDEEIFTTGDRMRTIYQSETVLNSISVESSSRSRSSSSSSSGGPGS